MNTYFLICLYFITNIRLYFAAEQKFDALKYIHNLNIGKVIIDTDGGCDDAIALLLALHQKPDDILAITTTIGNTNRDQVIINVLKTLRVLESKIPVYPGSETTILEIPPQDNYYGYDGFGDVPDPDPPSISEAQPENAVLKMIELVNERPGEVTVIAIGPLTNIALAIRLNRKFIENVKTIVWMGGSVQGLGNIKPGVEYNAYFDPAANFIVFNSTVRPIIMATWELLFLKAPTTVEWRRKVLGNVNSSQVDFLNKIENYALEEHHRWASADSKTIAMAFNPELVTDAALLHVEPITDGEHTKGSFMADYLNVSKRKPNAIVIENMNVDGYKEILLTYLKK